MKRMAIKLRDLLITALIGLVLSASAAFAQYPNRPIRLILPYNPGGIVDYVGRALAQHLGEALNQTVVPENRPGAGGILGTEVTARAQPDGYTLLLMDNAIVINPSLQQRVPYDLKQLDPISWVSSSPLLLVVPPALNVKTLDAFVAYAKANPGQLNFATAGIGTAPHLAAELFKQHTGITATHVPYKGIGASYIDLMSNKIQFSFSSIAGAIGFTSDKRVLALATTGKRAASFIPTRPP
jgi:tripartite-type tricarboxylate transporter receptor subunit TctC